MNYRLASDNIVGKVLDDEAVIINLTTGIYYGLDGPAAKIWECAAGGVPRDAIAGLLARHYPAEAGLDERLDALLAEMTRAGLLAEDDTARQAGDGAAVQWPAAFQPLAMTCYDDVAELVALDPPLPELPADMLVGPQHSAARR